MFPLNPRQRTALGGDAYSTRSHASLPQPECMAHLGLHYLLGGWLACRRALQLPMRMCARAMAFALGYHWLTVVGRPAYDTAPVLVANHISFVDPIVLCAVVECSFLAASEASIASPHLALAQSDNTVRDYGSRACAKRDRSYQRRCEHCACC